MSFTSSPFLHHPPLPLPRPSLFPPPPQATLESGGSLNASSIHDVASLLKQYLRELPSPLLTPPLLPVFEACHELLPPGEDQRRATLLACLLLPSRHLQASHLLLAVHWVCHHLSKIMQITNLPPLCLLASSSY